MAQSGAEKSRLFRERHPERIAEYYRQNKERRSAYLKAYRQRHKERLAEYHKRWTEANPERYRDIGAKRRAHKRERFVEDVDSGVVFARYSGRCGICGKLLPVDDFHLDHIVPLSRGGVHSLENVQPAHASCNRSKHNRWPTIKELEAPGTQESDSPGP